MNKDSQFAGLNIVIMAGGTGGHVFPALAVAKALAKRGGTVSWLGAAHGIEVKVVPEHFPLDLIEVKGIRNKGKLAKLSFPFQLLKAVSQARKILKTKSAAAVIGFGGYASGPGALVAKLLGIPVFIHEQNAKAGKTNQWVAKFAKEVMCAFPCGDFGKRKVHVVGNPVRQEILEIGKERKAFNNDRLNILVIGGSLGAKALNECVPKTLSQIDPSIRPNVWHQTGERTFEEAKQNYAKEKVEGRIEPFIKNMSEAYQWADLIICRAGASTVSEVAAVGLPAIFVPYPYAVDDHQYANAQVLTKVGAAACIREKELTPEKLAMLLNYFHNNREALKKMSQNAAKVAVRDSVKQVINIAFPLQSR